MQISAEDDSARRRWRDSALHQCVDVLICKGGEVQNQHSHSLRSISQALSRCDAH